MTIPASQIVQAVPSVLSAGGTPASLQGLLLTNGTRAPIGSVLSFPTAAAVGTYFGLASVEYAAAQIYFGGFTGSSILPPSVLYAQYPTTAVSAWLRGGSVASTPLITIQGISGTLSVVVGGYTYTAAALSLATATSFSSAATLIQTGLNTSLTAGGTSTTSTIAVNAFTGTISGTTLTVTAVTTGLLAVGQTLTGGTTLAGTTIIGLGTGTGGTGTYLVNLSQSASPTTASGATLTVAGTVTGTWAIGQTVTGGTTSAGTIIIGLGTGIGGAGTYLVNNSQTVTSSSLASSATPVVVTYDTISGAFVITSGVTGVASTIAVATGTTSAGLALTTATGAVTSQGAAAAVASTFMSALVLVNNNWASFTTLFNPDSLTTINTAKLAFANWNGTQINNYMYVAWDPDPTANVGTSTTCLGYILNSASTSGTMLFWGSDYTKAVFACGITASINFTQANGRITYAFKSQSGLNPDVTDPTTAGNLVNNYYNFYGSYALGANGWQNVFPGSISGQYKWADAYINQIWMNNAIELSLMTLLETTLSIPYNAAGYALIDAACQVPIQAAVTFGAIRAGVTPSALEAAQMNNAAGTIISTTVATRGWYLQISPASAQTRAIRGSPPMTLWYMDGGAVQQLSIASVEVQ